MHAMLTLGAQSEMTQNEATGLLFLILLALLVIAVIGAGISAAMQSRDEKRTWEELTGYVSQRSMTSDLAKAIRDSDAREDQKREIAAHVANGDMDRKSALTMLKD